jgi:hypothetical protein
MLSCTHIEIQNVKSCEQALDGIQIPTHGLGLVGPAEKLHSSYGGGAHFAVMLLKQLPHTDHKLSNLEKEPVAQPSF